MLQLIFFKKKGLYTISMTVETSYYAVVHSKTPEWHCFGIRTPGTYKITCNGIDDYSIEAITGPTDPTSHSFTGPTPPGHMVPS
jgi:hypothetical protein